MDETIYYDPDTGQVRLVYRGCDRKDTPEGLERASVPKDHRGAVSRDTAVEVSNGWVQSVTASEDPDPPASAPKRPTFEERVRDVLRSEGLI